MLNTDFELCTNLISLGQFMRNMLFIARNSNMSHRHSWKEIKITLSEL